MRKSRFLLWLYITVFTSVIIIAASVLLFLNITDTDTPPDYDGEPPTWGSCTTYIENENGSVRLTDTVGFAFDFEAILLAEKCGIKFGEIPAKVIGNRPGHVRLLRDSLRMLREISRIKKRVKKLKIEK